MHRQRLEHIGPGDGVGLHDPELLVGEAAGLVEDVLRDGDLADIVQGRGQADEADLLLGEGVLVGFLGQAAQQQLGDLADAQHMQAALAVAELDDVAQNIHHQAALAVLLLDLLHHQAHQLFLFIVQQQGVDHPAVDDQRIEGAADKVRDAELEGPLDAGGGVLGRDHDDRDGLDPAAAVHLLQHAEAVHLRHHDVQQHQRDLLAVAVELLHGLDPVFRLDDLVLAVQHVREDRAVHLGIVRDQQLLLGSTLHAHNKAPPKPARPALLRATPA